MNHVLKGILQRNVDFFLNESQTRMRSCNVLFIGASLTAVATMDLC